MPEKLNIIAHDADWQFPAITEQHAFSQAKKHLGDVDGIKYLAFPWATLIDQLNTNKASAEPLLQQLAAITDRVDRNERIITVCQHIHLQKFKDLFFDYGVTDIFWTHATKSQKQFIRERSINVYPFPLFPVQFERRCPNWKNENRQFLFSFIGARANKWYLTESRNWILDYLGGDKRGLVVGRDQWHYNKIVYDLQVKKKTSTADGLVDEKASEQFREVLSNTIFSLCPSGSGPNSIRLWESIGAGCIPVVLADTYAFPGDNALWDEAVVHCKETPEAIQALPAKLEALAADPEKMAGKRHLLSQLWNLYGGDRFIYDIEKLYIEIANKRGIKKNTKPVSSIQNRLTALAESILSKPTNSETDLTLFLNACSSRILIDQNDFIGTFSASPPVREAHRRAMENVPVGSAKTRFEKVKKSTNYKIDDFAATQYTYAQSEFRIKICLKGSHANRTPLAYEAYLPHFEKEIEIVEIAEDADIIVTGFNVDFTNNPSSVAADISKNPNLKLAVISEEPMWDIIWSKGYQDTNRYLQSNGKNISYKFFNHMNSKIFDFDKIPYFLTTQDEFFARYGQMFSRNSEMSVDDLLECWNAASTRAAFYAEHRDDQRYNVIFPQDDIEGLCPFRTAVAQNTSHGKIVRVGAGWGKKKIKRQVLPDWHLDKITALDGDTLIVSGMENTHQRDYITEKIFDAFAVQSIPLYYASPNHRIHEIVPSCGFLNLYGMSALDAAKMIDAFRPTRKFAENYLSTQNHLAALFSDVDSLIEERKRVADAIIGILKVQFKRN